MSSTLKVKKTGHGYQHPNSTKVSEVLTKEETVRFNANIPKSLHREIKTYAVENDSDQTKIVIAALREYLNRQASR